MEGFLASKRHSMLGVYLKFVHVCGEAVFLVSGAHR